MLKALSLSRWQHEEAIYVEGATFTSRISNIWGDLEGRPGWRGEVYAGVCLMAVSPGAAPLSASCGCLVDL